MESGKLKCPAESVKNVLSVGVRVGVSYLSPNLGPLGRVACRACVTLPERKEKSAKIRDQIYGTYVAENVPRNL